MSSLHVVCSGWARCVAWSGRAALCSSVAATNVTRKACGGLGRPSLPSQAEHQLPHMQQLLMSAYTPASHRMLMHGTH